VGARQPAQIVSSTYTGQTYTVSAYLPDGYSASAQNYPAIYMLGAVDGFIRVADLLDAKARQVILIAVTIEPERREIDLTMPEAPKFYDFFAHELIPLLEAQYRVDTSSRTLAGHSLGGLFAGLVMLFETPGARLFGSFISSDGSFWSEWEQTVQLEQELADVSSELPVNLILTAAAGRTSNLFSVIEFRDLLTQRSYADFNLTYVPFALGHDEVYLPSLRAGIDVLFP
jgi:predicted alpha/beta superfamily hydrolase